VFAPKTVATRGFNSDMRETDSILYLLPCGLRDVKDPAYLVRAFSDWHAEDRRIHLCIIGPPLDPKVLPLPTAVGRLPSAPSCAVAL
jgi:hypothetical protein